MKRTSNVDTWRPGGHTTEERRRARGNARALRKLKDELVRLRIDRKMSQTELGDLLGMSQSAVSQFEAQGNDPRLSTIRKYALAVGARLTINVSWAEAPFTIVTTTLPARSGKSPEETVVWLPPAQSASAREQQITPSRQRPPLKSRIPA